MDQAVAYARSGAPDGHWQFLSRQRGDPQCVHKAVERSSDAHQNHTMNRRDFLENVSAAGLLCGLPQFLFPARAAGEETLSPKWLELVSPESLGMAPDVLAEIDDVIEQTIAMGHTPGAVVAVGRGNQMCFLRGYGHRQFHPEKEKITLDTIFDLASVTKVACTATAMAVVMDQGKVSLDDLVTKYLPEFGTKGKEAITVRHCFTHTSGVGEYHTRTKGTREELWKLLCDVDLRFPVGEKFEYRDNNTLLLGHIVEKVSGQNLRDFCIQNIYHPLGMMDTMHNPDPERRKRAAATETRNDVWFKGVVNDYRAYHLGGVAGHCGLFSTAPDLAILSALWLGKGTYHARDGARVRLFSEETARLMTSPQFVTAGVRGLNWDKRSGSLNRPWNMTPAAFGHGGWTGTSIWIDPKLNLFVVVLGNRRHPFGKTPNIYPSAARVGVLAVNSIRRQSDPRSAPAAEPLEVHPSTTAAATKPSEPRKIGLVVSRTDIDQPEAWPSQAKGSGVEVGVLYFVDELSKESDRQTYQTVPAPLEKRTAAGAPIYALTRDCPRILPPMLHGIDAIVFAARIPADASEDHAWFTVNVLGQTLQSAADHDLKYSVVEHPNPLEKKRVEPTDLVDKLKPFGIHHRTARAGGQTLGEVARQINKEQMLELEIEVVRSA